MEGEPEEMNVHKLSKTWVSIVAGLVLLFGIYYYPLPYFISQPGDAIELKPLITVSDQYEEEGTFMLTTVRMGGANLINYAWAHMNEYMEIIERADMLDDFDSEEEYSRYQLQVMQASQDNAIYMAYKLADKEINVEYEGVLVAQIISGMPASGQLRIGDQIIEIDGLTVLTSEELIRYVHGKNKGDTVQIVYLRGDEPFEVDLQLAKFSRSDDEPANLSQPSAGIGIAAVTKRSLQVDPPVEINTSRIGGPSAGLMFTLEIYNQLLEQDITNGYRIVGTGTIDSDGNVGRIGGVHQKVVAADRARADYFFVPRDTANADRANAVIAQRAADDIEASLVIVPVDTIYEALEFLESLR